MADGAQGINPLSFLREAISAVPAVRFALGVGGIAAVIAIVAGFLDLRIALVGIPIVFIFMIILLIVSRLAGDVPSLRLAIALLVWFSILIMVLAILLFAVTFFVRADTLLNWRAKCCISGRPNSPSLLLFVC
jgi:hypothetical protein